MTAKLYALSLSHPAQAARCMLEYKGIDHEVVEILAGPHDIRLRLAGFSGGTVPALKLDDGRRIQSSLEISRVLEELKPEPPLFPADPAQRAAVEEAEAWGEGELQPAARRIGRAALVSDPALRKWFARFAGFPLPGLVGPTLIPIAHRMARSVGATQEQGKADVAALPGMLDHVDELIAAGTIGGDQPNAADFQIAASVRYAMTWDDLRPFAEGRPAGELAMRLLPDYAGPIPKTVPDEWLAPARAASTR